MLAKGRGLDFQRSQVHPPSPFEAPPPAELLAAVAISAADMFYSSEKLSFPTGKWSFQTTRNMMDGAVRSVRSEYGRSNGCYSVLWKMRGRSRDPRGGEEGTSSYRWQERTVLMDFSLPQIT